MAGRLRARAVRFRFPRAARRPNKPSTPPTLRRAGTERKSIATPIRAIGNRDAKELRASPRLRSIRAASRLPALVDLLSAANACARCRGSLRPMLRDRWRSAGVAVEPGPTARQSCRADFRQWVAEVPRLVFRQLVFRQQAPGAASIILSAPLRTL